MNNLPAGITVKRNINLMVINWKDGHLSEYPFRLLRGACPCVTCRGGHDQMSDRPNPNVFYIPTEDSESCNLVDVFPVGSYAISIQWEDGHSAGIYNWDYLRLLCPCSECRNGVVE